MVIKKIKGKYYLYSKKTHRHLGTFTSKAAAIKREKQINMFKHMKKRK